MDIEKKTARQEVTDIIHSQIRGGEPFGFRVFIDRELYERFRDEMLPVYRARYGTLVAEAKAAEDGFENILYQGKAVCLKVEDEP